MDAIDLATARMNFGLGVGWAGGNFDLNTVVDAADIAIVRNKFGFAAPVSSPEPITAALLSVSVSLLLRRAQQSRYSGIPESGFLRA